MCCSARWWVQFTTFKPVRYRNWPWQMTVLQCRWFSECNDSPWCTVHEPILIIPNLVSHKDYGSYVSIQATNYQTHSPACLYLRIIPWGIGWLLQDVAGIWMGTHEHRLYGGRCCLSKIHGSESGQAVYFWQAEDNNDYVCHVAWCTSILIRVNSIPQIWGQLLGTLHGPPRRQLL